jgi:hypothetical protein
MLSAKDVCFSSLTHFRPSFDLIFGQISLVLGVLEEGTEKALEDISAAVTRAFGKGEAWRVGLAAYALLSSPSSVLTLPHRLLALYLLFDSYRSQPSSTGGPSSGGLTSSFSGSSKDGPLAAVASNPFLPLLLQSLEKDLSSIEHYFVANLLSQSNKDV